MSEIKRFVEETQLLSQLIQRAAQTQLTGSFAARHPMLGKMKTCPYCHIRERQHQCRAQIMFGGVTFGKSLRAKRRIVPRLTKKRPPLFLVRQLLVELEAGRPSKFPPDVTAKQVEGAVLAVRRATTRKKNSQQHLSRRINAGLASPGRRIV